MDQIYRDLPVFVSVGNGRVHNVGLTRCLKGGIDRFAGFRQRGKWIVVRKESENVRMIPASDQNLKSVQFLKRASVSNLEFQTLSWDAGEETLPLKKQLLIDKPRSFWILFRFESAD